MRLKNNIQLFMSINYNKLCKELENKEFKNVFYEIDLYKKLSSFDVITCNFDNTWTEYDNADINNTATWISYKDITLDNIRKHNFNIVQYYKAAYIAECIHGNIIHLGQFLNRPGKPFKVVYQVPSLKYALECFEYPNLGDIIREVRDCLERPDIQLSVTIPDKGYDIKDIGIECNYKNKSFYNIIDLLRKWDLISIDNYGIFTQGSFNYKLSHFKLVFEKGNLMTCKLYLIPNK